MHSMHLPKNLHKFHQRTACCTIYLVRPTASGPPQIAVWHMRINRDMLWHLFSPRAFPSPPAAVDVAGSMGPADAYAGWIDGAGVVHVVDFSTTADHTINPPARMVAWDRYGYGLVSDGVQGVQCGPSDFRPMPILFFFASSTFPLCFPPLRSG